MQLGAYKIVEAGGVQWALSDTGTGPAVLLLHGFPDTPQSWTGIARDLVDAGNRVVIPYLPGYHPQALVPGKPRTSTEVAAMLGDLLDVLDVDAATLVGHDWGADIAYRMAVTQPERVRALVPIALPHPATIQPSPGTIWRTRHVLNLRMPLAALRVARNDFRYLEVLYERWAPYWFGLEREASLARAKTALSDPKVLRAALGYYRALSVVAGAIDTRVELSGPGLVVAGEHDMIPLSAYRRTVAGWDGDVRLHVVERAGHWPHREDEGSFLAALHGLLERLPA